MSSAFQLPPGQQLAAAEKWPIVGERIALPCDGEWTIRLTGLVARPIAMSLSELCARPQSRRVTDVHCVTRWSKPAMIFAGVPLAELLDEVGVLPTARFISFVAHTSRRHSTSLPLADALSLETLIATSVNDAPLPADHGGPIRTVVPGRYFYKSLKWLAEIELLAEDRLGYWEANAGYHNGADPWREERFIVAGVDKREAARIATTRDVAGRELLGLDVSGADLTALAATAAILRNARFDRCMLERATFTKANLSGASFRGANLRGATFANADAEGVEFAGADLRGVDFTAASLIGATLVETDDEGTPREGTGAIVDETTLFPSAIADQLMPAQLNWLRRQPSQSA